MNVLFIQFFSEILQRRPSTVLNVLYNHFVPIVENHQQLTDFTVQLSSLWAEGSRSTLCVFFFCLFFSTVRSSVICWHFGYCSMDAPCVNWWKLYYANYYLNFFVFSRKKNYLNKWEYFFIFLQKMPICASLFTFNLQCMKTPLIEKNRVYEMFHTYIRERFVMYMNS